MTVTFLVLFGKHQVLLTDKTLCQEKVMLNLMKQPAWSLLTKCMPEIDFVDKTCARNRSC